MGVATITPGLIKTGPGILRYAPLGTAIPAITATASKVTATWTNWIAPGATDAGMTYTEANETAEVRVAESLYPIKTVVTSKTSRVAAVLNEISDLNWKLVMNGGVITVTGSAGTKLSEYVPPLAGAESNVMLSFVSYDDTECIVWPDVFNVGSVETARATVETKAGLPFEFNANIPTLGGWTTPYKRWTAGALAASV